MGIQHFISIYCWCELSLLKTIIPRAIQSAALPKQEASAHLESNKAVMNFPFGFNFREVLVLIPLKHGLHAVKIKTPL